MADPLTEGHVHLTVTLEAGRAITTVREETLAPLRPVSSPEDLAWHADQWTQETIGVDWRSKAGKLSVPVRFQMWIRAPPRVRRYTLSANCECDVEFRGWGGE